MLVSSPLSRRTVLKHSGLGVVALSLPVSGWVASPAAAAVAVPALRRSTWLPLVGQRVATAEGASLRVDAVTDLAGALRDAGMRDLDEAFVVSLSADGGPALASGLHELQHAAFGSVVLFISPVGDRGQYELVVDRTVRIPAALDAPQIEDIVAESASAAVATAAVAPSGSPARPLAARRLRVRASARRVGGKLVATLAFPSGGVKAVRIEVHQDGRRVASGTGAVKRGEATVPLRARRRLARGRYTLLVTVTDRQLLTTTVERTITIR